ncbi:CoA ester lyase [Rhodococcus opacus]|nr:CoA ester lyase [Rhodococcus opacus]
MKPLRSLLFVPGHRGDWAEKGVVSGADALIFDLEDSVPDSEKARARQNVADSVARLRAAGKTDISLFVRLNALESGLAGEDLEHVAIEGVNGFMLPKVESVLDLARYDGLASHFERRAGLAAGSLVFIPTLETAAGYSDCDAIARGPRVAYLFAGVGPDGDVARTIGFRFTTGGNETLYLRSRAVLAARAAGVAHPLGGTWQDLDDDAGAQTFALQNEQLGFRGHVLIHPSHVALANEIFAPSPQEIDYYRRMVEAYEQAEADGVSAIRFDGMHVDVAHIKTAREVLARATSSR